MPKKIQQYSTTLTPSNNVLKTLEIKQTPSVSFPAKFSPELLTWTTPVSGHFYLLMLKSKLNASYTHYVPWSFL